MDNPSWLESEKQPNEIFAKLKTMKGTKEVCTWNSMFLRITIPKKWFEKVGFSRTLRKEQERIKINKGRQKPKLEEEKVFFSFKIREDILDRYERKMTLDLQGHNKHLKKEKERISDLISFKENISNSTIISVIHKR